MKSLEFRFAFYARDFDRSVAFYRDTLGMERVGGWDRPDGKGALFSAGGADVIEIYGAAEGQTYDDLSPVAINLAIRLENTEAVDNFHQRLAGQGIERIEPPQDRPWRHRSFVVYDPDDIPIHFYCELDT